MRIILLIAIAGTLVGCGSTWIIRQAADGGTIGYKDFSSPEAATKAVYKEIHCKKKFTMVEDRFVSGGTRTAYIPMQSTNYTSGTVYGSNGYSNFTGGYRGTQTQTNYVPMTVENTWREFTYRCEEEPVSSESLSSAEICSNQCAKDYTSNKIKSETEYASCVKSCS